MEKGEWTGKEKEKKEQKSEKLKKRRGGKREP